MYCVGKLSCHMGLPCRPSGPEAAPARRAASADLARPGNCRLTLRVSNRQDLLTNSRTRVLRKAQDYARATTRNVLDAVLLSFMLVVARKGSCSS